MKTQFTPGPWKMHHETSARQKEYEHGTKTTILGKHTSFFGIAVVGGPSNRSQEHFDEQQANARLIAAAPELLHALEDLLKEINLSKLNIRKDFSLINAHAQANKAAKKARGEI